MTDCWITCLSSRSSREQTVRQFQISPSNQSNPFLLLFLIVTNRYRRSQLIRSFIGKRECVFARHVCPSDRYPSSETSHPSLCTSAQATPARATSYTDPLLFESLLMVERSLDECFAKATLHHSTGIDQRVHEFFFQFYASVGGIFIGYNFCNKIIWACGIMQQCVKYYLHFFSFIKITVGVFYEIP